MSVILVSRGFQAVALSLLKVPLYYYFVFFILTSQVVIRGCQLNPKESNVILYISVVVHVFICRTSILKDVPL